MPCFAICFFTFIYIYILPLKKRDFNIQGLKVIKKAQKCFFKTKKGKNFF